MSKDNISDASEDIKKIADQIRKLASSKKDKKGLTSILLDSIENLTTPINSLFNKVNKFGKEETGKTSLLELTTKLNVSHKILAAILEKSKSTKDYFTKDQMKAASQNIKNNKKVEGDGVIEQGAKKGHKYVPLLGGVAGAALGAVKKLRGKITNEQKQNRLLKEFKASTEASTAYNIAPQGGGLKKSASKAR